MVSTCIRTGQLAYLHTPTPQTQIQFEYHALVRFCNYISLESVGLVKKTEKNFLVYAILMFQNATVLIFLQNESCYSVINQAITSLRLIGLTFNEKNAGSEALSFFIKSYISVTGVNTSMIISSKSIEKIIRIKILSIYLMCALERDKFQFQFPFSSDREL